MALVGVTQGATAAFAVLQDYGIPPEGQKYVCRDVASRGSLVAMVDDSTCALVSGAMPATAVYLGFLEQDVVGDASAEIQFGYRAQQKTATLAGDPVTIWRAGRFLVTNVVGSVATGAKLYPADGGAVSATQTGSAPAVGVCVKGNSAPGGPIEAEIFLIGRPSL
jgi:predicted RecA/RadA family phage recombinase